MAGLDEGSIRKLRELLSWWQANKTKLGGTATPVQIQTAEFYCELKDDLVEEGTADVYVMQYSDDLYEWVRAKDPVTQEELTREVIASPLQNDTIDSGTKGYARFISGHLVFFMKECDA